MLSPWPAAIEYGHLMTPLCHEMPCHREAHDPDTEKSDFGHVRTLGFIVCERRKAHARILETRQTFENPPLTRTRRDAGSQKVVLNPEWLQRKPLGILTRAVGFHVKCINGVATRHVEAIVLGSAESEIWPAFRKFNQADRFALGVEHHHAVQVFGFALEPVPPCGRVRRSARIASLRCCSSRTTNCRRG
jgi:hypothetical protein